MTEEATLNGLHPNRIKEITESFRNPDVLAAVSGPWRARIQWEDGFRVRAHMRTHTVEMDEPADLDATDVAASAHEQILAAVGSCMSVGFILNATKRGIRVQDLEVAVEGNFENIAVWAGVSDTGSSAYGEISAKAYVRADADEETIQELWKLAVDGSPVTQTVVRNTNLTTEIEAL